MPSSLPVADIENSRLKLLLVFAVFLLPFQINGFYNPLIQDNAALFWLLDIGSFIILPAGLLWLATKRKWLPQGSLCLHFPEKNNARIWFIIYTVLLCPALYLLYYYSYLFAGELFPVNYGAMPFSYQSVIPQTKFLAILTGIHFSLTAGIVEEIYYRGV
ncbi:MAG: hypothetical protein KDI30_13095, partial [Pseudomonadales bacterium]|nr:hypothetical protein [Pseudomonadales bacterium]